MSSEKKLDREEIEDSFRRSLEDILPIAEGLSSCCESVVDLIGMISLGISNQGQLRLIMNTLSSQAPPEELKSTGVRHERRA